MNTDIWSCIILVAIAGLGGRITSMKRKIMKELSEVLADVAAGKQATLERLDTIQNLVNALKAQIDAGSTDAVGAALQAVDDAIVAARDEVTAKEDSVK